MGFRLLALLAAAAALSGCGASGEVAVSPLARPIPEEPGRDVLCASIVYGMTCVAPRGFDLAEERPGPGLIMRYSSRETTPPERSHLILRAYPLGRRKLSWVLEENILGPLRKAPGVAEVKSREASLGPRRGYAVMARRAGETWAFTELFFAFSERGTVFVTEHAAPATRAKAEKGLLEAFVDSIAFR
ncbi:MAG: hypothetical protein HY928_18465 [Elusimicrobia bacterium]|nr:hypothetical protein [Elusimicrobiota bacterium]